MTSSITNIPCELCLGYYCTLLWLEHKEVGLLTRNCAPKLNSIVILLRACNSFTIMVVWNMNCLRKRFPLNVCKEHELWNKKTSVSTLCSHQLHLQQQILTFHLIPKKYMNCSCSSMLFKLHYYLNGRTSICRKSIRQYLYKQVLSAFSKDNIHLFPTSVTWTCSLWRTCNANDASPTNTCAIL